MSVAVGPFPIFAASQAGTPGPANMAPMATGAGIGLRRALPFAAGLIVHLLPPKARVFVAAGFTTFTEPGTNRLEATALIAICLLSCQIILHPLWTPAGGWIAARLSGMRCEPLFTQAFAALIVLTVLHTLFGGGEA